MLSLMRGESPTSFLTPRLQLMSKPKILSLEERVKIIFGTLEDAMGRISRIDQVAAAGRMTDKVRFKRQEDVRRELKAEIERLVRGRGRDMLNLVREYVNENGRVGSFSDAPYGVGAERYLAVNQGELLAVIDAGIIAEDEPAKGERCPLCERGIDEHTRVDLYGVDAILCFGGPERELVIGHGQALSLLTEAATREAQRQFDELTKGNQSRANAEDYAAIMDAVAALPDEQFAGIAYEGGPVAGVIQQLLSKGPVLDRDRLEAVIRDAVRQSLAPLNLKLVDYKFATIDDVGSELEYAEAVAGMIANLLKAIFPVRVEHLSMEAGAGVEQARRAPEPPVTINGSAGYMRMPEMVEGQTHWLIGNDFGLFYKVDAEGRVIRLDNHIYAPLHEERIELTFVEQTSNMQREYHGDESKLVCPCGQVVSWQGFRSDAVNGFVDEWIAEHKEHEDTTSGETQAEPAGGADIEPDASVSPE